MGDEKLAKHLIQFHEGYRDRVYPDTEQIPTCGIGHALHMGSYVPDEVVQAFFESDLAEAIRLYDKAGLDLDPIRRAAMIDMFFNLGPQLLEWELIEALREKDYIRAGDCMVNSKWWRQVGRRSSDLWMIIMTGKVESYYHE